MKINYTFTVTRSYETNDSEQFLIEEMKGQTAEDLLYSGPCDGEVSKVVLTKEDGTILCQQ